MREYIELGRQIYHHRDTSDFNLQRLLVFIVRACLHQKQVQELKVFFLKNVVLQNIVRGNPIFFEQLTRHVFYHQSTVQERFLLIKNHFSFCLRHFQAAALEKIYYDQRLVLWEADYKQESLSIALNFQYVDRKEGLLSIELALGKQRIYHITFGFSQDEKQNAVLWIGALQGSFGGADCIRDLTKHFFGYRPKNLILYALRLVALQIGVNRIKAISNLGFFTNTHVRLDRKLKTSLDDFWEEAGGGLSADERFFELPLLEKRKTIDEVKSQKRNLYRKRYVVLDEIAQQVTGNLTHYLQV
ncbi:VirK/YbjX family protein [Propionispira raffinosivorans]|uniref:VirK/YbjX family protein n=1 Tax=Propionispira raffinosivorans TaxID=86959 RepID=UPI00037ED0D2|nr:DUF535 family protein [Propionispira raffinosivorans]